MSVRYSDRELQTCLTRLVIGCVCMILQMSMCIILNHCTLIVPYPHPYCTHTCSFTNSHTHTHTHTLSLSYIHVHPLSSHTFTYTHSHMRTYTHSHIRTYSHTHTLSHIHSHTHTRQKETQKVGERSCVVHALRQSPSSLWRWRHCHNRPMDCLACQILHRNSPIDVLLSNSRRSPVHGLLTGKHIPQLVWSHRG